MPIKNLKTEKEQKVSNCTGAIQSNGANLFLYWSYIKKPIIKFLKMNENFILKKQKIQKKTNFFLR